MENTNNTNNTNNHSYDQDKKMIYNSLETVRDKGLLLLEPMDKKRRVRIQKIVENIPDISCYTIINKRQMFLRYKPNHVEWIPIKELINKGSTAYQNKDYDACIEAYKPILEFGKPKPFIYAKIGLSYMRKGDIKTAVDYLTVATVLDNGKDIRNNFKKLIKSLNTIIDVDKFDNDLEQYYNINNIEEIARLVSNGTSLEDACKKFELDSNQINIVNLIFAREWYYLGNYTMGNKYLKKVETTKDKSLFVKKLFKEVTANKKLYKHKNNENHKSLILIQKRNK